uniref:Ovule protein n=1 Tax=Meloidogyne incognita TaxID=6306 RepID=A0A914M0L5_MELIC
MELRTELTATIQHQKMATKSNLLAVQNGNCYKNVWQSYTTIVRSFYSTVHSLLQCIATTKLKIHSVTNRERIQKCKNIFPPRAENTL